MRGMTNAVSDASHVRLTALVRGQVQAVGYRAFVQRHARDLGLAGYAENLADGRVEIVAEGPRDALEQLLVHVRNGPTHAVVDDVEASWGEAGGARGFHTY
jgi:acylphosphatase